MSIDLLQILLDTRLQTLLSGTLDVVLDNTEYKPTPGVSFVRSTLDEVDSDIVSIGCRRGNYIYTVQVLAAMGNGTNNSLSLSKSILNYFEGFVSGKTIVKAGRITRIGETRQWYQRNVIFEVQDDDVLPVLT